MEIVKYYEFLNVLCFVHTIASVVVQMLCSKPQDTLHLHIP